MKADCHRPSSYGQVYTDAEALSPDTRTIIRSININLTEILHVNCRGYFAVNDQAEILDLPRKYTADNAARPSTKHTSGLPALHYLSTYCFWDLPNSTSNCILSTGQNCSLLQTDYTWNLYTSHQNSPVLRLWEKIRGSIPSQTVSSFIKDTFHKQSWYFRQDMGRQSLTVYNNFKLPFQ